MPGGSRRTRRARACRWARSSSRGLCLLVGVAVFGVRGRAARELRKHLFERAADRTHLTDEAACADQRDDELLGGSRGAGIVEVLLPGAAERVSRSVVAVILGGVRDASDAARHGE